MRRRLESTTSLVIIGICTMGGAMAAHLLSRGWAVQVCDIDPAKVSNLK